MPKICNSCGRPGGCPTMTNKIEGFCELYLIEHQPTDNPILFKVVEADPTGPVQRTHDNQRRWARPALLPESMR